MNRMADIYYQDRLAGKLEEIGDSSYRFTYNKSWLAEGEPVSVKLPLRAEPFESNKLFSFFAGLVPEFSLNYRFVWMVINCFQSYGMVSSFLNRRLKDFLNYRKMSIFACRWGRSSV